MSLLSCDSIRLRVDTKVGGALPKDTELRKDVQNVILHRTRICLREIRWWVALRIGTHPRGGEVVIGR